MGGPGSGAKSKIDSPEVIEAVTRLYSSGMSQSEVAATIGSTQKVVFAIMQRNGIPRRRAIKRSQSGPANHMWKGNAAGYQALHLRVAVARGTPSQCQRCGRTDGEVVYEWANLTGDYTDIADYERMCRSCHRLFDAARR